MTDKDAVDQKAAMRGARHALQTCLMRRKELDEDEAEGPFKLEPDGTVTPTEMLGDAPNLTLEQLQEAVGGYIEVHAVYGTDWILVLDEEGKLKGKEVNPLASGLQK